MTTPVLSLLGLALALLVASVALPLLWWLDGRRQLRRDQDDAGLILGATSDNGHYIDAKGRYQCPHCQGDWPGTFDQEFRCKRCRGVICRRIRTTA